MEWEDLAKVVADIEHIHLQGGEEPQIPLFGEVSDEAFSHQYGTLTERVDIPADGKWEYGIQEVGFNALVGGLLSKLASDGATAYDFCAGTSIMGITFNLLTKNPAHAVEMLTYAELGREIAEAVGAEVNFIQDDAFEYAAKLADEGTFLETPVNKSDFVIFGAAPNEIEDAALHLGKNRFCNVLLTAGYGIEPTEEDLSAVLQPRIERMQHLLQHYDTTKFYYANSPNPRVIGVGLLE